MARARSQPARVDKSLGHFVKTNAESIARIAHWVPVTALDVVLDIGCGDGAVLLGLAQQTGCRGVGVEIDKDLYSRALQNAKALGLDNLRMTFYCRPIEEVPMEELYDTQGVSLVYIYALFVAQNRAVVRLLQQMLARGVRVVSSTFELPYRDFGAFERVWPDIDTPEGVLEFIGPSCTTRLHLYPGDLAVDTEARKAAVEAVRADAHQICQMSMRLRGDRDVVFLAVRAHGLLLQYASAFLRDDENMVWTAISTAPKAVKYASIRMRESQKLAQHVVGVEPSLIRYFPRHLKLPLECQIRAVERSERAAAFLLSCAPSSVRQRERLKCSKRPWDRFQRGKSAGRPDAHPDPDPVQPLLDNRGDDSQNGKRLLRRQMTGSELSRRSRSGSSSSDPDAGRPFPGNRGYDRRDRPSTPRRKAKGPELSRASTSASSSSDPGLGRSLPSNRGDDLHSGKSPPGRQVNASELSTTSRSGSSSSDSDCGRPFPGNRGDDRHDRKSTLRRKVNGSDLFSARRSGSSGSSSGSSDTQLTEDCSTSRSHDACSTQDFCTSDQLPLMVGVEGKAQLDSHLPHLLPHAPQCDIGEVPSTRESGGQATQELSAPLEEPAGTTSRGSEGSHSQTVHLEGDGLLACESTGHPEAQEGGECLESQDLPEQVPCLPGEVTWQCQSCNSDTGHSYSSTTCFWCGELRGQGQVAESWGELDPSSDSLYPEVRGELKCDTVHTVHTADGWRLPLLTDSGAELLRQGVLEGTTVEAPESHACAWEVLPPWQLWHRSRNDTLQLFNTVSRKCEMFFPRFRR